MITINSALKGENAYDITVCENNIYRVYAFTLENAIDLVADYVESHNADGIYIECGMLNVMAQCSRYHTAEAFAEAHNLTRCGTNGIYLEITNVKGCPNG